MNVRAGICGGKPDPAADNEGQGGRSLHQGPWWEDPIRANSAVAMATSHHKVLWAKPEGRDDSLLATPEKAKKLVPTIMRDLITAPLNESLDKPFQWGDVRGGILRQQVGKSAKPTGIPAEVWEALATLRLYASYSFF